jgi:polyhydroxybutyrate depolymerase
MSHDLTPILLAALVAGGCASSSPLAGRDAGEAPDAAAGDSSGVAPDAESPVDASSGPADASLADAGSTADATAALDAGSGVDASGIGADAGSGPDAATPPGDYTRTMTAWPDRSYDVHVPRSYDGSAPVPVILALHGGGGGRDDAKQLTCPDGDLASSECLTPLADSRGFAVVTPDGTGPLATAKRLRTWNAGGGSGGWQCVSGAACTDGVDEAAYFSALLADLSKLVRVDRGRVFATGHSNGAAMAERLACELPGGVAGVASIAGGNQYSTTLPCTAPTPVLEIHGTDDPCWSWAGGPASCADKNPGSKISVPATLEGWASRNGCASIPTAIPVPDVADDGTTTTRYDYDCPQGRELVLYEVAGGGHTWPGGSPASANAGLVSKDFSANHVILDFFAGR